MGWRYQPVIRTAEKNGTADICISLCEITLNENDELIAWTEDLQCGPLGEDVDGLIRDISRIWIDSMCWKPVNAEDLKVGMTFEKSVEQSVRNELAEFLEQGGSLLKSQQI